MDSKVGLIIQLNGVFVITVLCLLMSRSLRLTALKYWAIAWPCLSFSLICLRLAFSYQELSPLLLTYYYLGEYLFGFLLVTGCLSLNGGWELKPSTQTWIIPFILLALVLPQATSDFNDVYPVHSLVMAGFYGAAFLFMRGARMDTFGWKVMHVALAALAIDFGLYSAISTVSQMLPMDTWFLSYNPVVNLVLQTALGFGMVIVLLEKVLVEARSAHERLQEANKRLEELVHTDPLTAAFTRHAFFGFVKKHGDDNTETSGCVGFFDIDDLKVINDRQGHYAGDLAIRSVAKAIRECMRPEDLLYRWGGDEFFVIMISMDAGMAVTRMAKLESLLNGMTIEGIPEPISIGVSWGFTDFHDIGNLESAINKADAEMYARKQARKQKARENVELAAPIPGAPPQIIAA
jgi:diguanylate cyclase (GGDEF)-like protein